MNPKTTATKKVFFASDFHLGIKDKLEKHAHEKRIVAWLESIRNEAEAIWLVGDIFDFWFEYDKVIPKGFSRFLGKIAEMHDEGIHIYIYGQS